MKLHLFSQLQTVRLGLSGLLPLTLQQFLLLHTYSSLFLIQSTTYHVWVKTV